MKRNLYVFWRNGFAEDGLFVEIQDKLFDLAGTTGGYAVGIETTDDCVTVIFYGFFLFGFEVTVGDELAD